MHGVDGLGNTGPAHPTTKAIEKRAPQFLIDTVREQPGEITIIALAPLTNLAKVSQPCMVRSTKSNSTCTSKAA